MSLIRDLPDPQALLDHPELKARFSEYERGKILTPLSLCERAEELVNALEWSPREIFLDFLKALRHFKPSLASTVEQELDKEGEGSVVPQAVQGVLRA